MRIVFKAKSYLWRHDFLKDLILHSETFQLTSFWALPLDGIGVQDFDAGN